MISQNTEQSLSQAAFWYSAFPSIVLAFIAVIAGAFMKDLVASSCATSGCPGYVPIIVPTIVVAFIAAALAHPILNYLLFSFALAERSITINSGIIFRQYETIDFNRIQTLDLERGPLLWLFGLTEVRLWTASADQFNAEDGAVHAHARPDTTILLARDTAMQFKEYIASARRPAPVV